MAVTFHPLGDTGVRVGFGERIDPKTHRAVQHFAEALSRKPPRGVVEWVPTYCAVTVYYRPFEIGYKELCRYLEKMEAQTEDRFPTDKRLVVLPVAYGDVYGPDVADLCTIKGMGEEELVSLHTRSPYLVYMMGFVPGFPYLGGMPEELAAPRLAHPRPRIPAGSVGIAGSQTGVYPLETPGGWRIIGRTPVDLYDPNRKEPILLKAGDYLQFQPIDPDYFEDWRQEWLAGRLTLEQKRLGEGK
ncbi:5-oxoprolinase subunit PxpB [Desmospora profundinema]|uniref:Inhibitor of KinA n=1 Tax=Desmospora profundinema TaxID=1571184 RepID=A0ABU1IRW3_9BACL|nr:5-oxoprolinase subunit PxpB [Desmospora profundinema]MDR6227531.1 inhibitor of KinA [Desmospora profundinema]